MYQNIALFEFGQFSKDYTHCTFLKTHAEYFIGILGMQANIFHLPVLNFFLAASDHLSLKQITAHEKTRLSTQLQTQCFRNQSRRFTDLVASHYTFLFVSAKARKRSFLSSPLYHNALIQTDNHRINYTFPNSYFDTMHAP